MSREAGEHRACSLTLKALAIAFAENGAPKSETRHEPGCLGMIRKGPSTRARIHASVPRRAARAGPRHHRPHPEKPFAPSRSRSKITAVPSSRGCATGAGNESSPARDLRRGSEEKKGEPAARGYTAIQNRAETRQRQFHAAGSATRDRLRLQHINLDSACASTIAAAIPLGPSPDAACFPAIISNYQITPSPITDSVYSRGGAVGHSTTLILPSSVRSMVGAYRPMSSRRHHIPVSRFSFIVVNRYCQSNTRICRGGLLANGLSAKSASTSRSFDSNCASVFGTMEYSRHEPSDANHRFQSNLRLVRRIDTRRLIHFLRLVTKWICDPILSVRGPLEFNFISTARHDCEQPVLIGDSEGLQSRYGGSWQRNLGKHPDQFCGGRIADPEQDYCTRCQLQKSPRMAKSIATTVQLGRQAAFESRP